jgi:hypothetical protein
VHGTCGTRDWQNEDFGHRPYPPAGKEIAQDGQGRSLHAIAAELAELGYFGSSG